MATAKPHNVPTDGETEASSVEPVVVPPADAPEQPTAVEGAKPTDSDAQTIKAYVTAPVGTQVPKASVLQTAVQSVRNAIPVVYELDPQITDSTVKTVDGEQLREWEVTITYTPRAVAGGKEEPVDVDKVIKGLDVPRSLDGIGGVEGDPDFLTRKAGI